MEPKDKQAVSLERSVREGESSCVRSPSRDMLRRQMAELKVYACGERGRERLKIIP